MTFLFTDIEGSTRLWESDPEAMRAALSAHDAVLRSAIEANGGWLFKHTGDGVCAAFSSGRGAVDAAVEAQGALELPVRMGIATGEAEERNGDYFGPVLNRTARVMAAGHGGQVLVAASSAALVSGVEMVDLGEHRLRDLSGAEHLYQLRVGGLVSVFPPLRTLDAVPGNLPAQLTSFVGREVEVKELSELVRGHRLVTLTGVGGVGKTRLAVQVAAELTTEFPDGVWLVELAPVSEPAAVPDVVAAVLGVTPQAGFTVTDTIVQALSGRRLLIVLDNCEHLLDAAGDLVETILARTTTVRVIASSREGLRVPAEQLWAVPSLDVRAGVASAAVELFVDRAGAVVAGFALRDDAYSAAVTDICRRLDGIALAIELAAARMVSMNPAEVLERLSDRFRLLSGSRRGLERHQTLRHAVQWSYDLLDDDDRTVLNHCSVFAGGFDLAAATYLCRDVGFDDYTVLDRLDSLVRKSLVTTEQVSGHTRYGLLETIRQFAEEQLAATANINQVRDHHARHFADQAAAHWVMWDGPRYRVAVDWVDVEFANLRTGFRWAAERGDLTCATTIAAHGALMGFAVQRYEPAMWAEEILAVATTADISQLPRLYLAASLCLMTGHVEAGVGYAQTAVRLAADAVHDPFEAGWSGLWEAAGYVFAGRVDRALEVYTALIAQPGLPHVVGMGGLLNFLPMAGRVEEALAIADDAVAAARAHGNPFLICLTLSGYGRAFAEIDPVRALSAVRQGLACAREHRVPIYEAILGGQAAGLEAVSGNLDQALLLFDAAIDSLYRAGNVGHLALAIARLAVVFDQLDRPDIAATLYGACTHHSNIVIVTSLPAVVEHLRAVLGESAFTGRVDAGAALELAEAVHYARTEIEQARLELRTSSDHHRTADAFVSADEQ